MTSFRVGRLLDVLGNGAPPVDERYAKNAAQWAEQARDLASVDELTYGKARDLAVRLFPWVGRPGNIVRQLLSSGTLRSLLQGNDAALRIPSWELLQNLSPAERRLVVEYFQRLSEQEGRVSSDSVSGKQ